jgi:hypothetical protein
VNEKGVPPCGGTLSIANIKNYLKKSKTTDST